uniref:Uncharacterized protein n=1 Tax=Arundo donax TaxID=35708 RepID=A0A0A8Z4K6_ARUDO
MSIMKSFLSMDLSADAPKSDTFALYSSSKSILRDLTSPCRIVREVDE